LSEKFSKQDLRNRVEEHSKYRTATGRKRTSNDMVFTPEIDRQIIEGFLKDQETLFANLAHEHMSKEAILRRAGELGFNKNIFSLIKRDGVEPEARKCLRCGKYFASVGMHNRLCTKCRKE
jgi:FPG/IleRS zinc finger protein